MGEARSQPQQARNCSQLLLLEQWPQQYSDKFNVKYEKALDGSSMLHGCMHSVYTAVCIYSWFRKPGHRCNSFSLSILSRVLRFSSRPQSITILPALITVLCAGAMLAPFTTAPFPFSPPEHRLCTNLATRGKNLLIAYHSQHQA